MFQSLRGNIGTRLSRVPEGGAIVVAGAALSRLGLTPEPMEVLGTDVMLPQVAQGALAIECRADDVTHLELLRPLNDRAARQAVDAERAFLATGGWRPGHSAGAPALRRRHERRGSLHLEGLLAAPGRGAPWSGAAPPGGRRTPSSSGRQVAESWSWPVAARNFWQPAWS